MKTKTIIKKIGYTPVDSGQIMLVDPCYVLESPEEKIKSYKEFLEDNEAKGFYDNYKNGFGVDLEKDRPDFEHGIVVTGFGGDGIYPVTVEIVDDKNSSVYGMTKSVTITFIEDWR
tara:strand:- start:6263 stop:6610 length:348 start_codon:yes stop_codon:yes gene_type:complete